MYARIYVRAAAVASARRCEEIDAPWRNYEELAG